jgi:hypothetical protein
MGGISRENAVQPKETKEAKKLEGFLQIRTLTCRRMALSQNFLSFVISRFFRLLPVQGMETAVAPLPSHHAGKASQSRLQPESICLLLLSFLFRFLLGAEFLDGGADVGFPGEGFVVGGVVGRENRNGYVHLLEQFGGLGEFVTRCEID